MPMKRIVIPPLVCNHIFFTQHDHKMPLGSHLKVLRRCEDAGWDFYDLDERPDREHLCIVYLTPGEVDEIEDTARDMLEEYRGSDSFTHLIRQDARLVIGRAAIAK